MDLEVDKNKFPKGMNGWPTISGSWVFVPALDGSLWYRNKEFYEAHRSWFLHDESGKPVSSGSGRYYARSHRAEAREHLKKITAIASREWGFEFFKIDGMSGRSHGYCAHLYERPEIRSRFSRPFVPESV
jgi:hypothetical protein